MSTTNDFLKYRHFFLCLNLLAALSSLTSRAGVSIHLLTGLNFDFIAAIDKSNKSCHSKYTKFGNEIRT